MYISFPKWFLYFLSPSGFSFSLLTKSFYYQRTHLIMFFSVLFTPGSSPITVLTGRKENSRRLSYLPSPGGRSGSRESLQTFFLVENDLTNYYDSIYLIGTDVGNPIQPTLVSDKHPSSVFSTSPSSPVVQVWRRNPSNRLSLIRYWSPWLPQFTLSRKLLLFGQGETSSPLPLGLVQIPLHPLLTLVQRTSSSFTLTSVLTSELFPINCRYISTDLPIVHWWL